MKADSVQFGRQVPLINTVGLARCRDRDETLKLFQFQQFFTREKPLKRLRACPMSMHRAKAAVLMRGQKSCKVMCLIGPDNAFTLIELLVMVGMLVFLSSVLMPGLARTKPVNRATQCLNGLRHLTLAWRQYSEDNRDVLLTCDETTAGRVNWVQGYLDFSSANGNWNPATYINASPMIAYFGQNASIFRCPADGSTVTVNGIRAPRVRSRSMSQVFGSGAWLDKNYNTGERIWRTYNKFSTIMLPAKTFVFVDEHPDSINDGAFASACTGNQPTDPPSSSVIIDYPANYHNGGCGISFADGHAEIHRWIGTKVGRAPITYTGTMALNVPAGDSWIDMHWLAENTTVRN
jgi:prepilin-type processing-associated H-X9-DG protein